MSAHPGWLRRGSNGLWASIALLTVIPAAGSPTSRGSAGWLAWFPIVGAALGGLAGLLGHTAAGHTGPTTTGVIAVALVACLSGGLHLDGLADTFDGLGGARGDRERMLSIMHDSRIGSYGAISLILVLAAKSTAGGEVASSEHWWLWAWATAVSRSWAAVMVVALPKARAAGLAAHLSRTTHPANLAVTSACVLAAIIWVPDTRLPTAAATCAAWGFVTWINKRLGGITGDVCGAAIELAETAFLLVAAWAQ